jgi:hypothetical protein
MNAFSYALYRAACLLMTESETIQAAQLAREADAGDTAAASVLRTMICDIVRERRRRELERAAAAD